MPNPNMPSEPQPMITEVPGVPRQEEIQSNYREKAVIKPGDPGYDELFARKAIEAQRVANTSPQTGAQIPPILKNPEQENPKQGGGAE